jgi:pimeloyl-ACP methyl ester carboxylesterase
MATLRVPVAPELAPMKVAQISKPGANFEIVEREIPKPAAGHVRIKVKACGVCHSDVLTKEGSWPGIQYPRVPGHEVAGIVHEVGAGVSAWKKGQRVGVGWHGGQDNTCRECRRGNFRNCQNLKIAGISYDGGYQQYMIAPVEALVPIPHSLQALGLLRYTLYMQDYGGPVGFRMALAHPDRAEALIVQDAVAHDEGLGANWKPRRAFWADRRANESTLRTNLLSLPTTRTRHVGNDPNVERYAPDLWTDEFAFLNQPGQADIQSDLFYDYRTNVDAYSKWQAWMREKQPRLLVIWGKYDLSFDLGEPERYRKDVPSAQVHVLDAGHFALDTAADEIAELVRGFVSSSRSELLSRRAG